MITNQDLSNGPSFSIKNSCRGAHGKKLNSTKMNFSSAEKHIGFISVT